MGFIVVLTISFMLFADHPELGVDPLDGIFRGVFLGMSVDDVEKRIERYAPPAIQRSPEAFRLQWQGDDLLKEEIGNFDPGAISNLTIKFRDGRVICAFYNFYYARYSQHLHRGECPYP